MNFLYNSVELPALPKFDDPYAFIGGAPIGGYTLYVTKTPTYYKGGYISPAPALAFRCNPPFTEWKEATEKTEDTNSGVFGVWANHDVVYTSDTGAETLYLAASDPVPVSTHTPNPSAMLMGFQLGAAIRRMRGMKQTEQPEEEKTLVGYSYNGVVLPDINELWAGYKTSYPCACICKYDAEYICLLTSVKIKYTKDKDGAAGDFSHDRVRWLNYKLTDGAWVLTFAQTSSKSLQFCDADAGDAMIWASYDIINDADGSTYLAASEPVPVYA